MANDNEFRSRLYEAIFKYLWIIIFMPKTVQLALMMVYTLLLLLTKKNQFNYDNFAILTGIYVSIYIVSISINLKNSSPDRTVATINTLATWVLAFLLYSFYLDEKININHLKRYCFCNCSILTLFTIVARIMYRIGYTNYLFPLCHFLFYKESSRSRLVAFMDYPNLIVAFLLMMFPGAILYVSNIVGQIHSKLARTVCVTVIAGLFIMPAYFCYSRFGYFMILFATAYLLVCSARGKLLRKNRILFLTGLIIILIIVAARGHVFWGALIEKITTMRPGSEGVRKHIYLESLAALKGKLLFGCGIKEVGPYGYPLGSHSTYIGFLYKTGIVGTLVITLAFIQKIFSILKSLKNNFETRFIGIFLVLIFAYAIFEDLDGADWLIGFFFICLSIFKTNIVNDNTNIKTVSIKNPKNKKN